MNKAGMKSLRGEAAGTPENAPGEAVDLRSVPASESRPHSSSWVSVWTFSGTQTRTRASSGHLWAPLGGLLWAPLGSSGLLREAPQGSSRLLLRALRLSSLQSSLPAARCWISVSPLPSRILSFLLRAFWVSF